MNESSEIRGSGAMFRYQDRNRGSGATFRYQDRMRIRVSHSDTRIVYGPGATFQYQDRMRIGVSRSDTRIVYEERSVTYRHKGNKDNES